MVEDSERAAVAVPEPVAAMPRRRPVWALPVVIVAVLVVVTLFVVGISGLFANPVQSINADGTSTLHGTFEPYQCSAVACDGYIQAGARSVFVQFPARCPSPAANSTITVDGKPAPQLGTGSYRATGCA